ncbi:MAG: hypothetical protein GEU83_11610 [Pseudonocardiaceae bacterium]|nr:hypothetical protein [Pseudonocardiaceae bacterium]
MTNTTTMTALADLTKPGGALDLGSDTARLIIRMLSLLAEGTPVARDRVDEAIADLDISPEAAEITLAAWTERDTAGTIRGLGLTYDRTAHRMLIDGNIMWAWCGMDTLIFAVVLGKHVTIESTAPGTHDVVRLHAGPDGVTDAEPADAVITWPRRDNDHVDLTSTSAIQGSFCHHSLLFPSRAHAQDWAQGRDDIDILPLEEGFTIAHEIANALLRYEPGPPTYTSGPERTGEHGMPVVEEPWTGAVSYRRGRRIGPLGTAARVALGVGGIMWALATPHEHPFLDLPGSGVLWWNIVLGLVLLPGALTVALRLRGRSAPALAAGPGTALIVTVATVVVIQIIPVGMLLALGATMLVSAVRGDAGCEWLAIPNWVLRRRDRLFCLPLTPLDQFEARHRRRHLQGGERRPTQETS